MPEQEQPEQQQQQFPVLNVGMLPDGSGMVISTVIMPGVEINRYSLGEGIMNQICQQWIGSRRQIENQLQLIQDINANKGRENIQLLKGVKR